MSRITDVNLFHEMLVYAQQEGRLVGIYRDEYDLRRFAVGRVKAVGMEEYILDEFDPEGRPDGFSIGRIEDILRIEIDTRYIRQIALLQENGSVIDETIGTGQAMGRDAGYCFLSELERAMRERAVVRFLLRDDRGEVDIFGIVTRLTSTHVQFDALTADGESDGVCVLMLDDIDQIRIDGRRERTIALFNKHRMHLYL